MNVFQKLWYRTYQKTIYAVSPFLNWRQPQLLKFDRGIADLPKFIKDKGYDSVLLVTDPMLMQLKMPQPIIDNCGEVIALRSFQRGMSQSDDRYRRAGFADV